MPQVRGPEIKDRAARLRAAGDAALARHLAAQVGQTHRVLIEGPRLGRTEQFTEVAFAADQPEGQIVAGRRSPAMPDGRRRLLAGRVSRPAATRLPPDGLMAPVPDRVAGLQGREQFDHLAADHARGACRR